MKGRIFHEAARVAVQSSREREAGKSSIVTKVLHTGFDQLVYSKVRAATGGKLRWAISVARRSVSGSATSSTASASPSWRATASPRPRRRPRSTHPDHLKIGTVGRPLPGVTLRIAEDDEVLIKGGVVFKGYWRNDEATAAASNDGWLATGDLGSLDEEGFLRITGRKKDLIITAGGKNVQPAELEDAVQASPLVSQCVVVGDGRPFIGALVTLDPEELAGWAQRQGRPWLPAEQLIEQLAGDPTLRAAIQPSIDDANKLVSRAESIREFRVLPRS